MVRKIDARDALNAILYDAKKMLDGKASPRVVHGWIAGSLKSKFKEDNCTKVDWREKIEVTDVATKKVYLFDSNGLAAEEFIESHSTPDTLVVRDVGNY